MTTLLQNLVADLKNLLDHVEAEVKEVIVDLTPLAKEIEAAGLKFLEQDGAQIVGALATGFASGQAEGALLAAAVEAAKGLAATQGKQLGVIALNGVATTLAAAAKAKVATDPATNLND